MLRGKLVLENTTLRLFSFSACFKYAVEFQHVIEHVNREHVFCEVISYSLQPKFSLFLVE